MVVSGSATAVHLVTPCFDDREIAFTLHPRSISPFHRNTFRCQSSTIPGLTSHRASPSNARKIGSYSRVSHPTSRTLHPRDDLLRPHCHPGLRPAAWNQSSTTTTLSYLRRGVRGPKTSESDVLKHQPTSECHAPRSARHLPTRSETPSTTDTRWRAAAARRQLVLQSRGHRRRVGRHCRLGRHPGIHRRAIGPQAACFFALHSHQGAEAEMGGLGSGGQEWHEEV